MQQVFGQLIVQADVLDRVGGASIGQISGTPALAVVSVSVKNVFPVPCDVEMSSEFLAPNQTGLRFNANGGQLIPKSLGSVQSSPPATYADLLESQSPQNGTARLAVRAVSHTDTATGYSATLTEPAIQISLTVTP